MLATHNFSHRIFGWGGEKSVEVGTFPRNAIEGPELTIADFSATLNILEITREKLLYCSLTELVNYLKQNVTITL